MGGADMVTFGYRSRRMRRRPTTIPRPRRCVCASRAGEILCCWLLPRTLVERDEPDVTQMDLALALDDPQAPLQEGRHGHHHVH